LNEPEARNARDRRAGLERGARQARLFVAEHQSDRAIVAWAGGDPASAFGGGATITSHLQTSASSLRHVKSLHRNGSEECAPRFARSKQMLDLIMVALGLAFFALSAGGTIACDRL